MLAGGRLVGDPLSTQPTVHTHVYIAIIYTSIYKYYNCQPIRQHNRGGLMHNTWLPSMNYACHVSTNCNLVVYRITLLCYLYTHYRYRNPTNIAQVFRDCLYITYQGMHRGRGRETSTLPRQCLGYAPYASHTQ